MKVKLQFQYFEGCPNHEKLYKNLMEAISGLEDKIELEKILVEDDEPAKKVKFRGSPTLLINGEDLKICLHQKNLLLLVDFIQKEFQLLK